MIVAVQPRMRWSSVIRMQVLLLAESNAENCLVECSSTTTGELADATSRRTQTWPFEMKVRVACGPTPFPRSEVALSDESQLKSRSSATLSTRVSKSLAVGVVV